MSAHAVQVFPESYDRTLCPQQAERDSRGSAARTEVYVGREGLYVCHATLQCRKDSTDNI